MADTDSAGTGGELTLSFTYAAGDTYVSVLRYMKGYCADVTTETGDELTVELIGPDPDGDYYGSILARLWDDEAGAAVGPTLHLVADRILIN